ncbi:hypothetical protein [Winogradskyella sp. SYSU M77433]|uniref:hypothetical protein n=1 Tax=Winogradskyella sp. SYSU M77433 TaxID=3042722 RepID=UPI00248085A9|nr:hypothetical protein [Winogradskyella sp. SYSU M77433]MDH7913840.1 hypothetical protein [Winogradskyella sp. SYSU M77433]
MHLLITLLQEVDIEQKLKDAPDDSYSIGVFIGTLLPFVVLVIIAYAIYRYNKNRIKD